MNNNRLVQKFNETDPAEYMGKAAPKAGANNSKCCDRCNDGDGNCAYPYYGVAPHECYWRKPGGFNNPLGISTVNPSETWPENFSEDPDQPGNGTYTHCLNCGRPSSELPQDKKDPCRPVMKDGELENFMVRIGGKAFRCMCGGNVFTKPDDRQPERYQCNSCGTQFDAE